MGRESMRAFLGFVAGAISVLVFHQGVFALLHAAGQIAQMPYPTHPVPPFGLPAIASLCFWGGAWGVVYAALQPRLGLSRLAGGLAIGLVATLVGWFVIAPLKGLPAAAGWHAAAMLRGIALNGAWGIGVSLIQPLLSPRAILHA